MDGVRIQVTVVKGGRANEVDEFQRNFGVLESNVVNIEFRSILDMIYDI